MYNQYLEKEQWDNSLRLGDVIIGFQSIEPTFNDFINLSHDFTLNTRKNNHFVVLTPCCSIDDKIINLAPLIKIPPDFYSRPYLIENITNINRPMTVKNAMKPQHWENKSEDEKNIMIQEGLRFQFIEYFIYGSDDIFNEYIIKHKNLPIELKVNSYMIDFRRIFTISSDLIRRGFSFQQIKVLQLKISTRGELRNKLSNYFLREPEEDKI